MSGCSSVSCNQSSSMFVAKEVPISYADKSKTNLSQVSNCILDIRRHLNNCKNVYTWGRSYQHTSCLPCNQSSILFVIKVVSLCNAIKAKTKL